MAHVPYVHSGTVGDHAAFVDITIKTTPTSLHFDFPVENHTKDGEEPYLLIASIFLLSSRRWGLSTVLKCCSCTILAGACSGRTSGSLVCEVIQLRVILRLPRAIIFLWIVLAPDLYGMKWSFPVGG